MRTPLMIASLLLTSASASAGVISNGNWTPAGCGEKPAAPIVAARSEDAFNNSVEAINQWQEQSKVYFDCLVKEANGDNATIAESANRAQTQYREAIDKIKVDIDAANKKLNQQ